MKIYKSIVNGKIFTTNNNGRIEVFTEKEFEELIHESWWKKKLKLIQSL